MTTTFKILLLTLFTSSLLNALSIKTDKKAYALGEEISVSVEGLAGNEYDWIGLFYAFDDNQEIDIVQSIGTEGETAGTFVLEGLQEAHNYEVRVFFDGSFDEEAYYSFKVATSDKPRSVIINEVLTSNAHKNIDPDFSKFSDWIELYNNSDESIDLSGYKLSDDINQPRWTIPDDTILRAGDYILFWADGKNISLKNHHTNFKLSSKGDTVALFDESGKLVDSIEFEEQRVDISIAKDGDTIGYMYPTPNQENWDMHQDTTLSNPPHFSKDGGFYKDDITVTLRADDDADIYYTTDGSYPTYGSKIYSKPIEIDTTTVLRAMSVEDGKFQSKRITNTYLIDEDTKLPVISITTNKKYLWDDEIGIYTTGTNGASKGDCDDGYANYMQKWKRPANIEYFDTSKNLGFNQEVELKISGGCSRQRKQKSLSIKADKKYGKDTIEYKLFGEKDIREFKSFKLRNSGQDWWKSMFRDAMIQQLVKDDLDVDYQAYEPSIVFLNGKYWGIHNIREKKNEDYLANNYPNLDPNKVDILYGRKQDIKEGDDKEYKQLLKYMKRHRLSKDENYAFIKSKIDVDNYIDYQITQIYIGNHDWPNHNIRYWKEQKDGAKWRWMMDDQDMGFYLFDETPSNDSDDFGLAHDTLSFALEEDSDDWRNSPSSTFFFRHLLENEEFEEAFVDRYNELLETTFRPRNVKRVINRLKDGIEDEMPRHIDRWGQNDDMDEWYDTVDVMLNFADKRPKIAKRHLDRKFR